MNFLFPYGLRPRKPLHKIQHQLHAVGIDHHLLYVLLDDLATVDQSTAPKLFLRFAEQDAEGILGDGRELLNKSKTLTTYG